MRKHYLLLASLPIVMIALAAQNQTTEDASFSFLGSAEGNSQQMIKQGRHIFRFDTFGDEAFWGDKLKLQETINHLTPNQALQLGLKVDSAALPSAVIETLSSEKQANHRYRLRGA